jgi:hypothetical protein
MGFVAEKETGWALWLSRRLDGLYGSVGDWMGFLSL